MHIDNPVCKQHAMCDRQGVCTPPVTNVGQAVRIDTADRQHGGPSNMARTRRRRGGTVRAVKRTVRRVKSTASRRAPAAGGDLVKSVLRALPIKELERRLAGLERIVARLEANVRGGVRRAAGGTRKRATAKRTTAKRTGVKRTTRRRTGTAKRAAAKRTTRKSTARRTTAKRTTARRTTAKRATAKRTTRRAGAKRTTAKRTVKRATAKRAGAKRTTAKRA